MSAPLKIAIAGLGTVGAGTLKLLSEHAAQLTGRSGRDLQNPAGAEPRAWNGGRSARAQDATS